MQVLNLISVIFEFCFIFWSVLLAIALAVYAAKLVFNKEAEEAEVAEAEAESWFARIECKLDLVLKMHGCDVSEEIIERPSESIYDKIIEIDENIHSMFVEDFSKVQKEEMEKLLKNLNFSCEVHKYEAPETEDKP